MCWRLTEWLLRLFLRLNEVVACVFIARDAIHFVVLLMC
jgi:hypothetical protein